MGKCIDETGKRYGKWTVIKKANIKKNGYTCWICQCDCGSEPHIVNGHSLRQGLSTSCGCITVEKNKSRIKNDLENLVVNNVKVLKRIDILDSYQSYKWECQCLLCNRIFTTTRRALLKDDIFSCGCVKSKGEQKISEILNENNIFFIKEKTFSDCFFEDTKKLAKFDFYIEKSDKKYIIEYDGKQHFYSENSGWNTEEKLIKTKEHDIIKNEYCLKNNIPLIRIPYTHLDKICLNDLLLETSQFVVNN